MSDYQFEFEGLTFGLHCPVAVTADGFDQGEDSLTSTDGEHVFTNSRSFGRDSWQPSDWTFELHTDTAGTAAEALADYAALEALWRATSEETAKTGEVLMLRYGVAGRERMVYGRPGQITSNLEQVHVGLISGQMAFRRADLLHYDAESRTVNVGMTPASDIGGLVAPLVSPITTLLGGGRTGTLTASGVGGDAPAPFRASITAGDSALLNPSLSGGDWKIELATTLQPGEVVYISTYPWDMGVTSASGAYLNGLLTPESRLSRARLNPSGDALFFDGVDSSGMAGCSVVWQPAYRTL